MLGRRSGIGPSCLLQDGGRDWYEMAARSDALSGYAVEGRIGAALCSTGCGTPEHMTTTTHDHSGLGRSLDGHSPHRRLWSDRFVGRERQLERIAIGLQAAADGKPTALILSGTAGLGMSRLLGETRRRIGALAEPFAAVHGVAMPATAGVPYAPVTAALEHLLAPLPDETLAALVGPTGDAIARLVPSLAPRLGELELLPSRPPIAATEWREARMFEAVLGLLERLGERQPVAVLMEDLHHADAATRGLVSFLSRVTRGQRVVVIGTYQPDRLRRSDPFRATLATMATSQSVTQMEVSPLDRADLGLLIEAIEGSRPSSTTLLLVAERSHGNPLIAEELLAARRELQGVSLAGTFDRLVTARAALRSPECRRVLRLLSLAGSMVTLPALVAMAAEFEDRSPARPPRSSTAARHGDVLESDIMAGVAEALEHGFFIETFGGPGGAAGGGLGGWGGERARDLSREGLEARYGRRDTGRAAGRQSNGDATPRNGRREDGRREDGRREPSGDGPEGRESPRGTTGPRGTSRLAGQCGQGSSPGTRGPRTANWLPPRVDRRGHRHRPPAGDAAPLPLRACIGSPR